MEVIDFKDVDRNIFKIVNQLEIKGLERRIPDGIVYVNGLPVVVLEFKSAVKEDTTIMNAYTQLTVRYRSSWRESTLTLLRRECLRVYDDW